MLGMMYAFASLVAGAHGKAEGGSFAYFAPYVNFASHCFSILFADCETQPRALYLSFAHIIALVVGKKNGFLLFLVLMVSKRCGRNLAEDETRPK